MMKDMYDDMLRELFAEQTEVELKAQEMVSQVCEFNQFNILGCLMISNVMNGFDHHIIAEKINALATPFNLMDCKAVH